MSRVLIFSAILLGFVLAGNISTRAQADRADSLAASLDKTKHKKKEKGNISVEVFVDMKNTAAVRNNPTEYSGVYGEDENRLELQVGADGSVQGSGYETSYSDGQKRAAYTLKDARISGAVMTGTRVFADGRSEMFEAIFVNRSVAQGKNPNEIEKREKQFGVVFNPANKEGHRIFLEDR